MVTITRRGRTTLRDAGVALAVLAAAYALGTYGFPPGYLVAVWFDLLQNAVWPGLGGDAYGAALAGYLAVLAVLAVGVASLARAHRNESGQWWTDGVGGALVVLGLLALGFGLVVLLGGNLVPAFVSGVTAVGLLIVGPLALRR